jgi:signal peptide peptidase SppA
MQTMMKLPFIKKRTSVAVVRMSGLIATSGRAVLNDQNFASVLERAFKKGKPSAVALSINSPGGSPVQSSLIGARIRRLANETNVPVFAFVEDVAASGGYWLAASADEIYADVSSIIGSIGVISSGFGLHELLERNGIERRVYTAGSSKSQLDPFKPENPADVARLKTLLDEIHLNFKTHVSERRGGKLVTDRDLFTGEIWTGRGAIDVGLIDGIGHLVPTLQDRFGEKVRFRIYGPKQGWGKRFGLSMIDHGVHKIEERAAFAQFGL